MFYRLRRKLSGRKIKRYIFTLTFMFAIFVMSLGYAALSQYMEIEGMAIVQKLWNVSVLEVTSTNTNSGSGIGKFETSQNVVSLSTTLPNLNSTVTYAIKFVNPGNVKGILHSIDQIEDKNTNITYTISGVSVGTKIAVGGTVTAIVTVQYKQGATSISTEPKKIMIGFQFVEDTSSSGGSGSGGSTAATLSSKILADNTAQSDSGIDFSKISSDTNGKGLYYTSTNTENNQKTYYFRGNVTNNYVKFGKDSSGNDLYWKIIRINEDGSIRIIYNGTSTTATGDNVTIGYSKFNTNYDDNAYVGYMHGYPGADTLTYPSCIAYNAAGEWESSTNSSTCSAMGASLLYSAYDATHANEKDSDIKAVLDNWYTNNLSSYSSYLADAGFCNDRSVASTSGTWNSSDTALGYAKNATYYGAYNRLTNNKKPQFACPNASNDLFTTSTSTKGNKALTNPIGLLTADEVWYAGATTSSNNTYYLYTGDYYWTMSPRYFNGSRARKWFVDSVGYLNGGDVHNSFGVRPVVNLKSTVTLSSTNPSGCSSQNGSASCPYIIDTGSSTTSYTVSVSSTNTNYGTVSPSSKTVASGSSAAFTLSPKSGYAYSSNTCGGTVSGNTMTISNVTANKTCTVTFKQSSTGTTLSSRILSDNTVQSDSGINFSNISSDTNGKGLYYTSTNTEGNQPTYYFRGAVTNNYVQFGQDSSGNDLYWKIIRINEDGSIRIIYNGTSTTATGSDVTIGNSAFNTNYDDNAYVGYMHGYPGADTLTYPSCIAYNAAGEWESSTNSSTCLAMGASLLYSAYDATHANEKDSDIKAVLDNWYTNNLSSYSSYLADAGFCNDRSVASTSRTWDSWDTALGYAKNVTYYGAYNRLNKNKKPQFACPNASNDLFTTSTSSKGNKALTHPIGLITADEAWYAGATLSTNKTHYLYTGAYYWTMSSWYFDGSYAVEWRVNSYGYLNGGHLSSNDGVRPVANLKSTVTLSSTNPSGCSSQNGSASCPYIIDTGSSSGTTSYTVSVSSTNTNYGTVSPSSKIVASGSSAAFTLYPKSGYAYSSNTCGGTVSGNTMTISNVTANKTCTVTFKQVTTLASKILADNTAYADNTSSTKVASSSGIDFSQPVGTFGLGFSSSTSYYFATSYTYNSSSKTYSLSGTKRYSTWSSMSSYYTTYPYTCVSTSSTGTCAVLYKMTAYNSSTSGKGFRCEVGVCSDTNGQGLYRTTQDPLRLGDSYYFRGDTTLNNFVKFGKYPANTTINGTTYTTAKDIYWRIIRINEDGNIRLLYAGVDPTTTSDDLIGYSVFNASTAGIISNDNVRYYLTMPSDIALAVEGWYMDYLLPYHSYIADSQFCNDIGIYSGTGTGKEFTEYAAYNRLLNNYFINGGKTVPTHYCNENSVLETQSIYTVANGNLVHPIGLMTADELVYAGAAYNTMASNTAYFHVDTSFWTMTPSQFSPATMGPGVFSYHYDSWNAMWEDNAYNESLGVRPVINLKSTVTLSSTNPSGCSSQNGSASCPYVVG